MRLSLNEFMLNGIEGEIGIAAHTHFYHDAGAIGTYSCYTEVQGIGYFGNRFTGSKHLEYAELPVGQ